MNWRDGGHYQGLIVRIGPDDLDRVGSCWMKGRLLVGDLAMAISGSGDCFWNYQLVQNNAYLGRSGKKGFRLIPESQFGAYVLGTPLEFQPTNRERHLLLAGEHITLEADPGPERPLALNP